MEILVVVGTLSGLGGIEVCVRSLAEEAQANGDRVRVLALCPSVRDAKWHDGIAYTEVANGSTSLKRQMVRGLPAFVRACKKQLPDAVVVIYSSTLLLVKLGLWIARMKRPVLAWLHFSTAHRQRTASSFPIGAAWLQRADHGARPKRASRYPTGCRPCPRDHGVAGADREPAILRNFARQSAD